MTTDDLLAVLPELILLGGAVTVAFAGRIRRGDPYVALTLGLLVALTATAAASLAGVGHDGFGGAVRRDTAALFFSALLGASTSACMALALLRPGGRSPQHVGLVLVSCAGGIALVSGGDLRVFGAGAFLLASPQVLLDPRGRGGKVALASVALIVLGALDLAVAAGPSAPGSLDVVATPLGLIGIALVIAGLAAIAGLVPLRPFALAERSRAPALFASLVVVTKIAGIGALLRIAAAITPTADALVDWRSSLAVIAAIAIVVPTLATLGETSVRRILVYTAGAHAGNTAVALTAGLASGPTAAFYLGTFAVLTFGALVFLLQLGDDAQVSDLHGLARRRPLLVATLSVLLLGLGGLPPTAGFIAKLYVLELAVGAQLVWLAIIVAIASVLGAVSYLRIVFACVRDGPPVAARRGPGEPLGVIAALAALVVGIVPGPLLDVVQNVRF